MAQARELTNEVDEGPACAKGASPQAHEDITPILNVLFGDWQLEENRNIPFAGPIPWSMAQ